MFQEPSEVKGPQFPRRTRRGYKAPGVLWYEEYKRTLSCSVCGIRDPVVISHHHLNPADKKYTISRMVSWGMSEEAIKRELKKTIPLCLNCHARSHFYFRTGEIRSLIPSEMSKREKLLVGGHHGRVLPVPQKDRH